MEQCLHLTALSEPLRTLELVLYIPSMTFFATWLLSFVHYDRAIFVTTSLTNYVFYGFLFFASSSIGWRSPLATDCDSFLYDIFEFQWPSASLITWLANGVLLVWYHAQRGEDWWLFKSDPQRKWTWTYSLLLVLTIAVPPLAFIAFLLLASIQSIGAMVLNVLSALLLVALLRSIVPTYRVADELLSLVGSLYSYPSSS
jgi:hypothetical protein